MIKKKIFLIIFTIIFLLQLQAFEFSIKKNIYPRNYELIYFSDNLVEEIKYFNEKLGYKYKLIISNKDKKIFKPEIYGTNPREMEIEIKYEKDKLIYYSIDEKKHDFQRISYFFNNQQLVKVINEQQPMQNEESTGTNFLSDVTIEEFVYKGDKLINHIRKDKMKRDFIYNGDKIKEVIYQFNDGKKVIDKYNYINDTDYICIPSNELLLEDPLWGNMDQKKHYEKIENGLKIIIDEYYSDNELQRRFTEKWDNDKLVEAIYNYIDMEQTSKRILKYENKIVKDNKSVYFTPSVSNLRFRETPDLNGKFIRSLNQDEKLELLEKGKEEIVNEVKGTWVKVKTEKGEVGWCFDAYLKEWTEDVKKN